MTIMEAIHARHSVRQYLERPLGQAEIAELTKEMEACNRESGLHIQLVTNEPEAFQGFLAHYGKFRGVTNYFALIGKTGPGLHERCGYYGERLALKAQQMGLNTCWVALTFRKVTAAYRVRSGEALCAVIAVGYGVTQGVPHKSKELHTVAKTDGKMPDWFRAGVEAALLAPTAMNQQKFTFVLKDGCVSARAGGGFYTKMDLGIVKYHFETGAGREHFQWT